MANGVVTDFHPRVRQRLEVPRPELRRLPEATCHHVEGRDEPETSNDRQGIRETVPIPVVDRYHERSSRGRRIRLHVEGQLGHRDRVPPGLDQGGELGVEDLRGNPQTRERIGGLRRLGDPVVREDRNVENQSASRPAATRERPPCADNASDGKAGRLAGDASPAARRIRGRSLDRGHGRQLRCRTGGNRVATRHGEGNEQDGGHRPALPSTGNETGHHTILSAPVADRGATGT